MNIATVATPSVPALDAGDDVTMCLIFRPGDPIGLTEVVIDPEPAEEVPLGPAEIGERSSEWALPITQYRAARAFLERVEGRTRPI